MLDARTGRTPVTNAAPPRATRYGARAGRERCSTAEPCPLWSNEPSVINILPLKPQVKHWRTRPPACDHPFKLEVTFCVRGVVSPTLSNILLTPFDREMRLRGYQLTRYADDWVITCKSAAEARAAVEAAGRVLKQLGVELHPQKTRIVHVQEGFEFLGYKIKRGKKKLYLPESKIRSQARQGALYAYPKEKSIHRFMDRVRQRTKRKVPLQTKELIEELNPLLRGWGEYYKRAHVRLLFNRLDRWILHRIWSHRFKRWRNAGWKRLPRKMLYRDFGLVNLVG